MCRIYLAKEIKDHFPDLITCDLIIEKSRRVVRSFQKSETLKNIRKVVDIPDEKLWRIHLNNVVRMIFKWENNDLLIVSVKVKKEGDDQFYKSQRSHIKFLLGATNHFEEIANLTEEDLLFEELTKVREQLRHFKNQLPQNSSINTLADDYHETKIIDLFPGMKKKINQLKYFPEKKRTIINMMVKDSRCYGLLKDLTISQLKEIAQKTQNRRQ